MTLNDFMKDVTEQKMQPSENDKVFDSIWGQYECIVLHSLITSFGLDIFIKDQYGGDVDTINNVRNIGGDSEMHYKNDDNRRAYDVMEAYDAKTYHSDPKFARVKHSARDDFDNHGTKLLDAYVAGNELIPRRNHTIPTSERGELDHVISAHKIHEDRGRVLAGLEGKDLANDEYNLRFTNSDLNRNKSDMTPDEYIKWCDENPDKVNWNGIKGEPLPEPVKEKMREEYERARKVYDTKLANNYYTSTKFYVDTVEAIGKRGLQMGLRQALGFFLLEIWIAARDELKSVPPNCTIEESIESIIRGVGKGAESAREKYKDMMVMFAQGFVSGAIASLTTTICNIFFTTSRTTVRNIRQVYASVTQAGSVLLFNPGNLMFGDRIQSTTVILATGASVIVGTYAGETIAKTPIGSDKLVGLPLQRFISTMVSGLISCSFLVFLDRSKLIKDTVEALNQVPTLANNYVEIADAFTTLAAKMSKLDIDVFKKSADMYLQIAQQIEDCNDEIRLNDTLQLSYQILEIQYPWQGDFDEFMGDKSNVLVFE